MHVGYRLSQRKAVLSNGRMHEGKLRGLHTENLHERKESPQETPSNRLNRSARFFRTFDAGRRSPAASCTGRVLPGERIRDARSTRSRSRSESPGRVAQA